MGKCNLRRSKTRMIRINPIHSWRPLLENPVNNAQGGIIACMLEMEPAPDGRFGHEGVPRRYPCPCSNEKRSQTKRNTAQ